MTTWAAVANQSTTFTDPSDEENNYVVAGYVANNYITGQIWSAANDASTTWSAAA